jgi:Zn-dependent peptidase ImmA (M78 family)
MYRVIQKRRCIFLNRKLDEQTARIVCAHEIGHDRLHRALAQDGGLLEVMLYDMTARPEYEANLVAAAILLPDEEVLRYVYEDGYSVEQIARAMATDVNLVAIKAAALKEAGHPIELPDHNTRFLQ